MARILLAEDSADARQLLHEALLALGHEVVVAADGEAAWQFFADSSFDLVITDWQMPRVRGDELVRRIRGTGSSVPIVVQTADPSGARLAGIDSAPGVWTYDFVDFSNSLAFSIEQALRSGALE